MTVKREVAVPIREPAPYFSAPVRIVGTWLYILVKDQNGKLIKINLT
jgi:hypothetical protein